MNPTINSPIVMASTISHNLDAGIDEILAEVAEVKNDDGHECI